MAITDHIFIRIELLQIRRNRSHRDVQSILNPAMCVLPRFPDIHHQQLLAAVEPLLHFDGRYFQITHYGSRFIKLTTITNIMKIRTITTMHPKISPSIFPSVTLRNGNPWSGIQNWPRESLRQIKCARRKSSFHIDSDDSLQTTGSSPCVKSIASRGIRSRSRALHLRAAGAFPLYTRRICFQATTRRSRRRVSSHARQYTG